MSAHERFDRGDVVPQSGLSCRGAKLTRHLSVTLAKNDLSLTISFEESEEEEPEDTEVEVIILQTG
ncbi:MAG: hypothetical protein IIC13_19510, partial [SAR324 cluster bacterium]|nr:hypothetical protein [SAR324 cluster bacterium]